MEDKRSEVYAKRFENYMKGYGIKVGNLLNCPHTRDISLRSNNAYSREEKLELIEQFLPKLSHLICDAYLEGELMPHIDGKTSADLEDVLKRARQHGHKTSSSILLAFFYK